MMKDKKVMVVPRSDYSKLKEYIDEVDGWDEVDVIIVEDNEFDDIAEAVEDNVPEGKVVTRFFRDDEDEDEESS